ncbi:hypothetical protein CKY02_21410 [Photorhabdus bodei]|uniref:Uncharacterized protein n=1 Tax=Photorhabdus bodei TaxID=2029681 RepID=A0A329WRZ3_9GAMM|nr:hypothetical protein CKY02_21410 [Photorhabdus bodei]
MVGRAGPLRLMPHYVQWRLTGNVCNRERRGSAPGGRHLPPALRRWAGSLCAGTRAVCLSLHPTRSQGTG